MAKCAAVAHYLGQFAWYNIEPTRFFSFSFLPHNVKKTIDKAPIIYTLIFKANLCQDIYERFALMEHFLEESASIGLWKKCLFKSWHRSAMTEV